MFVQCKDMNQTNADISENLILIQTFLVKNMEFRMFFFWELLLFFQVSIILTHWPLGNLNEILDM